jgi:hypothetical protein
MTRTVDHGPARGTDTFAWDSTPDIVSPYDGTDPSPPGLFTGSGGRPMRHPADGRCHFSEIRQHARSPAHVRLACTEARELTDAMVIGGVADSIVFGQRGYAVYPGKARVGKEWELFRAEHPGQYLPNATLAHKAEGAARAVLADPVARDLLEGCMFQKIVQWEAHGLPCASGIAGERGGIDAWNAAPTLRSGRRPYTADLKITSDVEPRALQRQAWRMSWIAQGAWLLGACEALRMPAEDHYIIAAEASPPHCVTVMRLSAESLEVGRRQVAGWCERHRQCEAARQWPGYVMSAVELEPEAWMVGDEGDE